MINPEDVTNYNRNEWQLEEFAMFSVLVAGKQAKQMATALDKYLRTRRRFPHDRPMAQLWQHDEFQSSPEAQRLRYELRDLGVGCWNQKADTILELARRVFFGLNLKTCTVEELESIKGIGPKTARFFVLHSRRDEEHAVLDTHILRWLRDEGYPAPKLTPVRKSYLKWEKTFLAEAEKRNMTPAELDLSIWTYYSRGNRSFAS